QVASLPFLARRAEVGEIPPLVPGPYHLRLLGADGVLLADHAFTPLMDSEGTLHISQTVPYLPGTRRIAIFSDVAGREIGSVAVSSSAPIVSITGRTGGPTPSGPITLSWNGSDADGDRLTYAVAYRPNSGAFWRPLGTTSATSFTVDAAQLEGT